MSQVVQVGDQEFQSRVMGAPRPVMVDFSATWCGPCKQLEPIIEQLAGEYAGRVDVFKMDVEEAGQTAAALGILSVPTLVFVRGGEVIGRLTGTVPKETLQARLNQMLG